MKFENGVTRNFKTTFVIQSSHYEPFLVFDTPAPLPKSRQNRSIERQWKLTNFKTY